MDKQEWISDLFNHSSMDGLISYKEAKADLNNFRHDGWDVPKGLTPKEYMDGLNRLQIEQEKENSDGTWYAVVRKGDSDRGIGSFSRLEAEQMAYESGKDYSLMLIDNGADPVAIAEIKQEEFFSRPINDFVKVKQPKLSYKIPKQAGLNKMSRGV